MALIRTISLHLPLAYEYGQSPDHDIQVLYHGDNSLTAEQVYNTAALVLSLTRATAKIYMEAYDGNRGHIYSKHQEFTCGTPGPTITRP